MESNYGPVLVQSEIITFWIQNIKILISNSNYQNLDKKDRNTWKAEMLAETQGGLNNGMAISEDSNFLSNLSLKIPPLLT